MIKERKKESDGLRCETDHFPLNLNWLLTIVLGPNKACGLYRSRKIVRIVKYGKLRQVVYRIQNVGGETC